MTRYRSILQAMILSTSLIVGGVCAAHEGHDHDEEGLTDSSVGKLADSTLSKLVQSKKVPADWGGAKRHAIAQQTLSGKKVWIVSYKDPSGKAAPEGGTLYVFFDDAGNYLDANHTGKLGSK